MRSGSTPIQLILAAPTPAQTTAASRSKATRTPLSSVSLLKGLRYPLPRTEELLLNVARIC